MRILRVAQNLYPEVSGGGTYHVHAMSRDQAAMGENVTVLTVSGDESLPRREKRDGYTVVRRSPTVELLGNEISLGIARSLFSADDFDVIHAHSHLYFSTNLAAIKRRLGDIPLAITNHGLYSQNAPEQVFDLYLRTVGQWTFNQADAVFCYTKEDKDRVRNFGVKSKIEVVANGVDTERFTPAGTESDLINHNGVVVLFIGRLVNGKRPWDAIEAVAKLPDRLNAKLYIVGDGPLREQLQIESDTVELLGHVPYDKMPAVYRSGDVLLLPSRAEGVPRTILEALSSGIPVVSSNLKQIVPIVQQGGKTVPVGDIEGYATALEQVLENRASLGEQGRHTILERHQWKKTVERTTAILHQLK